MKTSLWIGILSILAFVAVSLGQEDGKKYCQSVIQCYEEVAKLADDCQKQNANNKPANASSSNANANRKCKTVVSEKASQLKDKQRQHRQMNLDCLKGRVNEAMPVPAKQSAKCDGGSRDKRQAVLSTNVTTSSTKEDSSSGTVDNSAGGGGKGNGRGKGKGKGRGNGRGKGNGCQKQVHQKQQQCKQIAKCCSEVPYCHLKFELSDLHDQIRQLQLDILEQRRQCQKQQQASASSPAKASSNGNMLRDSPMKDDEDEDNEEDSFTFDHED